MDAAIARVKAAGSVEGGSKWDGGRRRRRRRRRKRQQ